MAKVSKAYVPGGHTEEDGRADACPLGKNCIHWVGVRAPGKPVNPSGWLQCKGVLEKKEAGPLTRLSQYFSCGVWSLLMPDPEY